MKTTGRYMGTSDFCPNTAFGVGSCFDNISGNLSSAVFLANAYVDLGTWWCLTPFIGAGVGTARNMLSGVQDQGIISSGFQGFGYTNSNSAQWNCWGCHRRPDLQRQRISQGRPELALPGDGLAADVGGQLSEHIALRRRLLHAAKRELSGLPRRPALDVRSGWLRRLRRPGGIRTCCRSRLRCRRRRPNICRARR